MKLSLSEILEKAAKQPNSQKRREVLYENNSVALQALLKYALDEQVKFVLPTGSPPYKKCELPEAHGMLYTNLRKLYLFVEGGTPTPIPAIKREQLFIELLETVDPKDAELLIAVKDKSIPYKGITPKFVNKTFPGLLSQFANVNEQDLQETE